MATEALPLTVVALATTTYKQVAKALVIVVWDSLVVVKAPVVTDTEYNIRKSKILLAHSGQSKVNLIGHLKMLRPLIKTMCN